MNSQSMNVCNTKDTSVMIFKCITIFLGLAYKQSKPLKKSCSVACACCVKNHMQSDQFP